MNTMELNCDLVRALGVDPKDCSSVAMFVEHGKLPRLQGMRRASALPDAKIKKSAIVKQRWEDADYRAIRSEHTKLRWEDPEYRARMSAMSKEKHALPGAKEQRAAAISATARARSKITPEIAAAIQQALSAGVTGSSLAAKYGVTGSLISTIKHGAHWACKK